MVNFDICRKWKHFGIQFFPQSVRVLFYFITKLLKKELIWVKGKGIFGKYWQLLSILSNIGPILDYLVQNVPKVYPVTAAGAGRFSQVHYITIRVKSTFAFALYFECSSHLLPLC